MPRSRGVRGWWGTVVAGLGVALGGCGEPPTVLPTAPPGIDPREVVVNEIKQKDEPEALGEVGSSSQVEPKAEVIPDITPALPTAKGETKKTASGVEYTTLKEGAGAVAQVGQSVTVHYVGTLDDGRKFDSTRDKGKPAEFRIGVGRVIKGWDEAIPGMKIGEVRKLTIPPSAGYGALGAGDGKVPPNATLHFEVELIDLH